MNNTWSDWFRFVRYRALLEFLFSVSLIGEQENILSTFFRWSISLF